MGEKKNEKSQLYRYAQLLLNLETWCLVFQSYQDTDVTWKEIRMLQDQFVV